MGRVREGCERQGFRLVQFSVQQDLLHLIVKGKDRGALVRGRQGLAIRVARALNRVWRRVGSVFADRYHDRILRTPRAVRNALQYVLQNGKRHGMGLSRVTDGCSSGPWLAAAASQSGCGGGDVAPLRGARLDGWKEQITVTGTEEIARLIAAARTWLLAKGWRRRGLISVSEIPGPPIRKTRTP